MDAASIAPDDLARAAALLPADAAPDDLGLVYERSLQASTRRARGVHHPPRALADALAQDLVAEGLGASPTSAAILAWRVLDPAMGTGTLLLAALRALTPLLVAAWAREGRGGTEAEARVEVARRCLYGVDLDPVSVGLARVALWLAAAPADAPADAFAPTLGCGDALTGAAAGEVPAAWVAERRAVLEAPLRERGARWRAWWAQGGALREAAERRCDAVGAPAGPRFHWVCAMPELAGGVEAVLANPPFGNAIKQSTARSEGERRYVVGAFAPYVGGAVDRCGGFWARCWRDLLAPGGVYAWLGPTATLAWEGEGFAEAHRRWRPRRLTLFPVRWFPEARVRTTAFVGGAGESATVAVCDREVETEARVVAWPEGARTWHEGVSAARGVTFARGVGVPLGEVAEVFAGCATGAAYELRDCVEDAPAGEGPRLITTGSLDRYRCRWGEAPTRFLKRRLRHPRWPAGEVASRGVVRARARQAGPKVLVGGLTSVIEAWADVVGNACGVVSVWVVRPRAEGEAEWRVRRLAALLNAATFSARYLARYGARSMSGRQVTIGKSALASVELPADVWTRGPAPSGPLGVGASREALWGALDAAARWLEEHPEGSDWRAVDALGHVVAGRLWGRAQPWEDYRAWCRQAGVEPVGGDEGGLWRRCVSLLCK